MIVPVSIVEDDAAVRELLMEWINLSEGFRCLSHHANAESAIARLPEIKPAIVLADINLPNASGIECVRRLKPLLPETQFLMLTVYEDSHHIFAALEAGAVGYLLKSTPSNKLIASLRQICEGGSPMTGYIARKVVQSFQSAPVAKTACEALSSREVQVLGLLSRGYFYKEIANALGIKIGTVNTHVSNIYQKLHVNTRARAMAKLKGTQMAGLPTPEHPAK